jgi:hypothetical protein
LKRFLIITNRGRFETLLVELEKLKTMLFLDDVLSKKNQNENKEKIYN